MDAARGTMDCKERILSEDYLDLLADYDVLLRYSGLASADYCYQKIDDQLYIVYSSRADVPNYDISVVKYESIPKCFGLMGAADKVSKPCSEHFTVDFDKEMKEIEQAQINGGGGFDYKPLIESGIIETNNPPLSLTGQNVIMAFIDTGIRYDLDVFKNPDGSTRILALWDQTIQSGMSPEGFYYGTEYKKEQIDKALQADRPYDLIPSRDELGHGTKMASVAAGSKLEGNNNFQGGAFDADLVIVKLKPAKQTLKDYFLIPPEAICYSETDILMALSYVQQFYQPFQRPLVICLGIGTTLGDHGGNSFFSNYLDRVAMKRNIGIVVCSGNEGNAGGHFAGTITGSGENRYQDVEIRVGENEFGFSMSLWGEIPNVFTVEIRSPDGETIPRISNRVGQINTYQFLYSPTIVSVQYVLIEQSSGQQFIFFKFEKPLSGIWTIRVYAETNLIEANFNLWLPIKGFLRSDTYYITSSPYTTMTEPAYADNVMTVSAYDSENNSFYLQSGRGFGRSGGITPDLAAPGVEISTILGAESGSSLAAAITAGAVANFMQWAVIEGNDTTVNSVTIRNYFVLGAKREQNIIYPSREWGFGRVDLAGVFRGLLT